MAGLLRGLFGKGNDKPAPAESVWAPKPSSNRGQEYSPAAPPTSVPAQWWLTGSTLRPFGNTGLRGEAHRQDVLERINADIGGEPVVVQLVRNADNPHDPGAVAAFVGADLIGFVAKDSLGQGSPLYRVLARESKLGAPVTAWGSLTPVTYEGRPTYLGINLLCRTDEPGPALPFEVTLPPLGYATLLGVESSQDALAKALGSKDEAFVELTLAVADTSPHRPDQPGPALVASLNGNPIGSLSAGESKARAPFVARLVDNGRPVLALARVKRSSGAKGGLICSVSTPST